MYTVFNCSSDAIKLVEIFTLLLAAERLQCGLAVFPAVGDVVDIWNFSSSYIKPLKKYQNNVHILSKVQ